MDKPYDLDDQITIKRFLDEAERRCNSLKFREYRDHEAEPSISSTTVSEDDTDTSGYEDNATQAKPATPTNTVHSNGSTPSRLKETTDESTGADHSKLKNPVLESVMAQSPQVSGVLAPPSTPESIPTMQTLDISKIIVDAIDDLPPGSVASLGESRYAPRPFSSSQVSSFNLRSQGPKDHHTSAALKQLSPADRKAKDESFSRMSFQAADFTPTPSTNVSHPSLIGEDIHSSKRAPRSPLASTQTKLDNFVKSDTFSELKDNVGEPAGDSTMSKISSMKLDKNDKITSHDENESDNVWIPPHLRASEKRSKASNTDTKHLNSIDNARTSASTNNANQTESDKIEPFKKTTTDTTSAVPTPLGHQTQQPMSLSVEGDSTMSKISFMKLDKNDKITSHDENGSDNVWVPPHLRAPEKRSKASNTDTKHLNSIDNARTSASTNNANQTESDKIEPFKKTITGTTSAVPTPLGHQTQQPMSLSVEEGRPLTKPEGLSNNADTEDCENALFFKSWPKSESRNGPGILPFVVGMRSSCSFSAAAKVRSVILKGLSSPVPSLVASIVFGGPLESIHIKDTSATVLFLHAEDCQKFFDATENGVPFERDGRKQVAFVEKGTEVDVVGGLLGGFIKHGYTRCVRVIDVDSNFPGQRLWEKAQLKNRKVESIDVGDPEAAVGRYSSGFSAEDC